MSQTEQPRTYQQTTRIIGQQVLYTLPSGENRPAIIVRALSPETVDLRLFCLNEDAIHFGGTGADNYFNAGYPQMLAVNRAETPTAMTWHFRTIGLAAGSSNTS
jgi:hypothetical protein